MLLGLMDLGNLMDKKIRGKDQAARVKLRMRDYKEVLVVDEFDNKGD